MLRFLWGCYSGWFWVVGLASLGGFWVCYVMSCFVVLGGVGGSGLSFQVCWWVGALVFLVVFCGFVCCLGVCCGLGGLLFGFVFGVWFLFRHGM